jgi:hypothetical protein
MPARNRPTLQDAVTARRILLDGLAQDAEVEVAEPAGKLASLHPRNSTFPCEVFLGVAADALDWCGASRTDPLALEGMPERFLPSAHSAVGSARSFSSRSWLRRRCAAERTGLAG